ncbi:hypothetical protein [Novipirellula caenicola]|uniref:DUF4115 domain-containing protein n=1 Tax=Novipirellula caenicola TaxID=1536901 RepID=A0ABP9VTE3_9BACT
MQNTNPYASPPIDVDSLAKRRRAIQVGNQEIHTVIVETSLLRGLQTHVVDAAGNATPVQRGTCRMQIGEREVHQVEVELDASQRVNVLVDGKRVSEDLFPRMRATIFAVVIVFMLFTSVTIALAMFLFT